MSEGNVERKDDGVDRQQRDMANDRVMRALNQGLDLDQMVEDGDICEPQLSEVREMVRLQLEKIASEKPAREAEQEARNVFRAWFASVAEEFTAEDEDGGSSVRLRVPIGKTLEGCHTENEYVRHVLEKE
ncbi:MAG: hypothetical protein UY50_C0016G0001 [Parcubacteria group bacterium GW2011_GWA2_49_9]|nr:MAG: hypothetical protein UY50_C0016G0001 [Parcubacteria group bacterium GW2011_GWA2_49_9]